MQTKEYERMADALAEDGYIILEDIFDEALLDALLKRLKSLHLQEAHISKERVSAQAIRSDKTHWLEGEVECEKELFDYFDTLQEQMNRLLYMGLRSYESHFAHYEKGSFYKKHSDVFKVGGVLSNTRVLTSVLYLTPAWSAGDGGELVIYNQSDKIIQKVSPSKGVMVLFLSEKFPHEVLPSMSDRYSIATWFKSR